VGEDVPTEARKKGRNTPFKKKKKKATTAKERKKRNENPEFHYSLLDHKRREEARRVSPFE